MTISEKIRTLARERLKTAEIARRLGIRYQHAYNVLKQSSALPPQSKVSQTRVSHPPHQRNASDRAIAPETKENAVPDLTNALVLVSCVSQKLPRPAPARELYVSSLFCKIRRLVESRNAEWLILSALHGVVAPEQKIAPYDETLNTAGVAKRRAWAEMAYRQLGPHLTGQQRIVMFAGQRYREFLLPKLRSDGYQILVPMEHLPIGKQLQWLDRQR